MKDHDKRKNQYDENIEEDEDDDFFASMSKESRERFIRVLFEVEDEKIREINEKYKDFERPPPTKRHMIRMNRLFRERVGGTFLPFPEEDCLYERVRSKIIVKLKINEFIDKCKDRRRRRRRW
jgi:hypothetical protein